MLSAVPSSGIVNSVIRITGIGDRDRPEWLIRISGIRTEPGCLQIWTGLMARTAPGWSLLVRPPANLASPGGYISV